MFFYEKLRNADMSDCKMKNTKFQGADLRCANFTDTFIGTTYFSQADLRGIIGFNWSQAVFIRGAIITQEQFDDLPDTIGSTAKDSFRFCIAPANAELTDLNYFQVRGTTDVEGTHKGAVVLGDPALGNQIGLLLEGTKVLSVENVSMIKVRGIWYRKIEPLPENEQEEVSRPGEQRVGGWVAGIYLMRVSAYQ